jgi:HSP20 family protein
MKNPFRNLDEIQRDLGHVAVQLMQTHYQQFSIPRGWQPPLNVFRCENQFIICVELAGVEKEAIHVQAESRRLTISGTRPLPEPSCDEPPAMNVLALEIDHGPFERVLELPADVDPGRVTAEHRNGLLWIKLPLRMLG